MEARATDTVSLDFGGERAAETLSRARWAQGRTVLSLSLGQYSATDWADALLEYVDTPARLAVATWNVGHPDLQRLLEWVDAGRIEPPELLLDQSFPSRNTSHQAVFERIHQARVDGRLGYRLLDIHAKWALIAGGAWRVVATSTSNWNHVRRLEQYWATDDERVHDELTGVHARLWTSGAIDRRVGQRSGLRVLANSELQRLPLV